MKQRQRKEAGTISGNVRNETARAIHAADPRKLAEEVFKAELTPFVREHITDEVVQGIAALMKLTPALVDSLGKDLTSGDPQVRSRAQGIVAKYTLGQADAHTVKDPRLVVNLGSMPDPSRPDTRPPAVVVDNEAERQCNRCGLTKDLDEFDGAAPRCRKCQAEVIAEVKERHGV